MCDNGAKFIDGDHKEFISSIISHNDNNQMLKHASSILFQTLQKYNFNPKQNTDENELELMKQELEDTQAEMKQQMKKIEELENNNIAKKMKNNELNEALNNKNKNIEQQQQYFNAIQHQMEILNTHLLNEKDTNVENIPNLQTIETLKTLILQNERFKKEEEWRKAEQKWKHQQRLQKEKLEMEKKRQDEEKKDTENKKLIEIKINELTEQINEMKMKSNKQEVVLIEQQLEIKRKRLKEIENREEKRRKQREEEEKEKKEIEMKKKMAMERREKIIQKRKEQREKIYKAHQLNIIECDKWTSDDIVTWIMTLCNGRFKKYEKQLENTLGKYKINGNYLMRTDIKCNDIQKWGIDNTNDCVIISRRISFIKAWKIAQHKMMKCSLYKDINVATYDTFNPLNITKVMVISIGIVEFNQYA
eukprot:279243_1